MKKLSDPQPWAASKEAGGSSLLGRVWVSQLRPPAELRVASQVNTQRPRRPDPSRRAAARHSRLTLLGRRTVSASPGRPACSGLGRPSPCGSLRGLQLPGGASLLEWERPAGQGGTRAFPRPELGRRRVRRPPEPPKPRAGPPPECASTCGPAPSPRAPWAAAAAAGAAAPARWGWLGSHLAPLGEGKALPRLRGGGAGLGTRRTGAAATPAACSLQRTPGRTNKTPRKNLGKSWEGSFLFSHPGLLLSFEKETEARLFSPAAFCPTPPSPGPSARSSALKPGLEGRRKPQPRGGSAQSGPGRGSASPSSAGGVPGARRAPRGLSPKRLTHPAPFPCPEFGSSQPPPPDGHPEVATRLGGIGASEAEAASRREKRGGGRPGRSGNFLLPGLLGLWGPAREAEWKGSFQTECSRSHR